MGHNIELLSEMNKDETNSVNTMHSRIAIVIIFGIFYRNTTIAPTRELLKIVKELAKGKGDLTYKIEVKTQDEIGELGKNLVIA